FQAEDGIRDLIVTGVQTCALPICPRGLSLDQQTSIRRVGGNGKRTLLRIIEDCIFPDGRFREVLLILLEGIPRLLLFFLLDPNRSEERRVGKECRSGMLWDDER